MKKINIHKLSKIAVGLNIEGYHPALSLSEFKGRNNCKWYNIVQVIDEPLKGETFDKIIKIKKDNNYDLIEEAVSIDLTILFKTFVDFITCVSTKTDGDILVHIHQLKGTTLIGEKIECILKHMKPDITERIQIIYDELITTTESNDFDGTSYNVKRINYTKEYPNIKSMISLSQCAGFDVKPGSWIVPDRFMDFDVKTNTIDQTNQKFVNNHAFDIMKELRLPYIKGNILVVNDLWNPDITDDTNNFIYMI